MKLDYQPPNEFMPDAKDVVSKKVERTDDKKSVPIKLETDSDNFELWFKQDDTFN